MKIIVDEAKCIGCGMCEAVSGGVLIMGDNVIEAGKMAAMACPQGAISVED